MSKASDYRFNLSSEAGRTFSDAAISLSLYFEAEDDKAEEYYYARYCFNIDYAVNKYGIKDEDEFEFYVREYARELNQ